MTYYTDDDRAAYRDLVNSLVADAARAARADGVDCTPQNIAERVTFDTELLDAMVHERIYEVTST